MKEGIAMAFLMAAEVVQIGTMNEMKSTLETLRDGEKLLHYVYISYS